MPQHVLVPVDGSDHAFAGLEYSLTAFPGADHSVLYVVDPSLDRDETAGSSEGDDVLERAAERASAHDRSIDTDRRTGRPHNEILAIANTGADHVVLGSHGESPVSRPFLGYVSEAVVRRSPVSTTLVPESTAALSDRTLPGEILVPIDGSEQAEAALEFALDSFPGGSITAFHALSLPFDRPPSEVEGTYLEDVLEDREAHAEEIFESATEIAAEYDASIETETSTESPATAIVERAGSGDVDQIVMGSHGSTLSAQLFTGSVAERVARRTPRTVTLVRGPAASD